MAAVAAPGGSARRRPEPPAAVRRPKLSQAADQSRDLLLCCFVGSPLEGGEHGDDEEGEFGEVGESDASDTASRSGSGASAQPEAGKEVDGCGGGWERS